METQSLRDSNIFPSKDVLATALGDASSAYLQLLDRLSESKIALEWRYYRDGKAWLGKGISGKKTIFWLSIWEGFFRISLYFTEKTRAPIQELPISSEIKSRVATEPVMGRLIPLVMNFHSVDELDDLFVLIEYKRRLK